MLKVVLVGLSLTIVSVSYTTTFSGKMENWNRGEVKVTYGLFDVFDMYPYGKTKVRSDGTFQFALESRINKNLEKDLKPIEQFVKLFRGEWCKESLKTSPKTARYYDSAYIMLGFLNGDTALSRWAWDFRTLKYNSSYAYFDQDASIIGESKCRDGKGVERKWTFNVKARKGWNLIITSFLYDVGGKIESKNDFVVPFRP